MKTIILFLSFMLFLFSAACGKEESTKVYSTPEGKVEVTSKKGDQSHEMTIKTEKGTTTMKIGGQVTPEDLGVPIYPNVEKQEGGGELEHVRDGYKGGTGVLFYHSFFWRSGRQGFGLLQRETERERSEDYGDEHAIWKDG